MTDANRASPSIKYLLLYFKELLRTQNVIIVKGSSSISEKRENDRPKNRREKKKKLIFWCEGGAGRG